MQATIISLFLTRSSKWVKKSILLLILVICFIDAHAQVNYVLNPSFEDYSKCPYALDQIKFANYWSPIDTLNYPPTDSFGDPRCTPEYCNKCAGSNPYAGVPWNGYFYPRTGNGMAHVMMYYDGSLSNNFPDQRNYLQGRLYRTLVAGKSYCVTFFVSFEFNTGYAINHIGAYLDNGEIDTTQNCGLPQTTHIPQVADSNVIFDSINWTKIEGSFTATGAEKFITIGNFFDLAHTTAVYIPGSADPVSFYLVDDVTVVQSETPAYAGGKKFKLKTDSVFIGRSEVLPDCEWYRNGVLIDTFHSGFWVKDTANTTYVVKQDFCGNVKYDTAYIVIAKLGVSSVGSEGVFKVYPNPATKEITIQTVNNVSSAQLAIYDLSGRVILMRNVGFVEGETHVPLALSGGVYVVELIDQEGRKNIQRLSIL
jgi:hypothetical protein